MTRDRRTGGMSVVVGVLAGAALAGCAGQQQSGFLKDYASLQPSPHVKGAMVYVNPARPLKTYNKFIVEPVIVHFAPDKEGVGVDPGTLKELTDHFHGEIVRSLTAGGYQVVPAAGPGVLRLRAAVTDIKKTVPVANIHPATKMSGIGLGGASMEAEGLDAQSSERVFAVTDSQTGSRLGLVSGLQYYAHAKEVMTGWAERLVKRLNEAHGRGEKRS